MGTENVLMKESWKADEDLRTYKYHIVVLDATSGKVRLPNAATDIPLGILQNAPNTDEAASVALIGCGGISKVVTGAAALAIGAIVGMEFIGATDAGKASLPASWLASLADLRQTPLLLIAYAVPCVR